MDYSDTIVNITFEIGDTTKIVNVSISNDCLTEGPENFNMFLRRFDTNVRLGSPSQSVGIITDTGNCLTIHTYMHTPCGCIKVSAVDIIFNALVYPSRKTCFY